MVCTYIGNISSHRMADGSRDWQERWIKIEGVSSHDKAVLFFKADLITFYMWNHLNNKVPIDTIIKVIYAYVKRLYGASGIAIMEVGERIRKQMNNLVDGTLPGDLFKHSMEIIKNSYEGEFNILSRSADESIYVELGPFGNSLLEEKVHEDMTRYPDGRATLFPFVPLFRLIKWIENRFLKNPNLRLFEYQYMSDANWIRRHLKIELINLDMICRTIRAMDCAVEIDFRGKYESGIEVRHRAVLTFDLKNLSRIMPVSESKKENHCLKILSINPNGKNIFPRYIEYLGNQDFTDLGGKTISPDSRLYRIKKDGYDFSLIDLGSPQSIPLIYCYIKDSIEMNLHLKRNYSLIINGLDCEFDTISNYFSRVMEQFDSMNIKEPKNIIIIADSDRWRLPFARIPTFLIKGEDYSLIEEKIKGNKIDNSEIYQRGLCECARIIAKNLEGSVLDREQYTNIYALMQNETININMGIRLMLLFLKQKEPFGLENHSLGELTRNVNKPK